MTTTIEGWDERIRMDLLTNKGSNVRIVRTKKKRKNVSHYKICVKFVRVMIMTLINAPKRTRDDVPHNKKCLWM